MRPNELTPLFASAAVADRHRAAPGAAAEEGAARCRRASPSRACIDLLWHLPTGVIDRRAEPTVADAVPGTIATLKVRVLKHRPPPRGNTKAPYKVRLRGRHRPPRSRVLPRRAQVHRAPAARWARALRLGPRRALRRNAADGASRLHRGARARDDLPMLEPVYPLTAGLSGKVAAEGDAPGARARAAVCPNGRTPAWLKARGWPDFVEALQRLHRPTDAADVSTGGAPWQRLAYDELLAGQLALGAGAPELQGAAPAAASQATGASARGSPTRCPSR